MKATILATLVAATALTGLAGVARADDDRMRCGNVPMDRWMSRDEMRTRATGLGLEVRDIEIDDGCYEVSGTRDGQRLEVHFNPETGEQVHVDGDD